MAAATPKLPLHCNICPKKPDFSDVSHLLTHIASKGHLSHYYKIKVRSGHDMIAKAVIDTYDQWYAHYNVEQLMSERMHLKDRKRPRQRIQATPSHSRKVPQSKPMTVDPLLFNIKKDDTTLDEYQSMTSYPPYPPWNEFSTMIAPKLYSPPMALWRTSRPRSVISMLIDIPSSPPPVPSMSNFRPGSGMAPQAQMWTQNALVRSEDVEEGASEATKLKGVYWPGMNIFDAATPEMKRKRNQKKDTSVAIQLERHSLFVEPTEMIFTPLGSLKKERVISGHADFDSSPDKFSPPTPKPKRRQPGRLPLSKKDSNVSSFARRTPSVPPFPGYGPVNNSNAQAGRKPIKRQPRNFEIFEDNNGQSLDNSTTMRFLTSGFRPATHSTSTGRPPPPTLLDINTGAMYHNNLFAEAIETYHPTFYGMPYYGHGYYGHTGIDFPSLFSSVQSHLANHQEDSGENIQQAENAEDARTVSARSDD